MSPPAYTVMSETEKIRVLSRETLEKVYLLFERKSIDGLGTPKWDLMFATEVRVRTSLDRYTVQEIVSLIVTGKPLGDKRREQYESKLVEKSRHDGFTAGFLRALDWITPLDDKFAKKTGETVSECLHRLRDAYLKEEP